MNINDIFAHMLQSCAIAVLLWVGWSIQDLNKNVAVIVQQVANHEVRIQHVESKL
ncbi:MAG TPA: hypothetical protein PL071_11160 [Nitrosomonas sp.]|nr:hypothetical protein [Nitrosomonas sp.]